MAAAELNRKTKHTIVVGSTAAALAALGVAALLTRSDLPATFSDHVAAERAAFSPRGPGLNLMYLTCRGEGSPEVRVTEDLDGREPAWEVFHEEFFGSPFTKGTAHYYMRRGAESQEHADALPPAEEALLEVTILVEDEKPLVIRNLQISDLAPERFTMGTGSEEDEINVHEWESEKPNPEELRGCAQ